jgi:glutathione synthase
MTTTSRHLFVLDPIENLNLAWDTSIKLAFAMNALGAEVYCTTIQELMVTSHPTSVGAHAKRMIFVESPKSLQLESSHFLAFSKFDAVHMRKEPPYDLAYVEALWILAAGRKETKILNDPVALQQMNEKLVLLEFPEFSRPLAVSSNPGSLADFAANRCQNDVVAKPLNLFGGRGVVHLKSTTAGSLKTDFERETSAGLATRLVQPFESEVLKGEVRAFAVGGRPLAWCLKVPRNGDFLANTRAGSTLQAYTPTAREVDVVTRVATELVERGVMVAGFDLIGGWLSEVNITCPALLSPHRESLEGFDELARRLMYSV